LENTRLLYVAVPRAICRLHLLFTASDEQRPPPQNSLIFPLWPTLQQTVDWSLNDADKQVEEQQDQQHTAQDQYLTRIDSSWQPPELIVDNPLSGLPAAQWAIARPMIEQAIDNTLADKRGQWLLSSKHRYARAELALLAQSSNDLRAHTKVIDRLLVDDNNVCWIVDYKTGHPQVGEKRDDFIARESAAYGQQLADYRHYVQHYLVALDDSEQWRRAVKARDNIKTALYFTYYPHWEEVSW
jgi:ATP-dependent exoDNAse (exonuclease V) beta subunit